MAGWSMAAATPFPSMVCLATRLWRRFSGAVDPMVDPRFTSLLRPGGRRRAPPDDSMAPERPPWRCRRPSARTCSRVATKSAGSRSSRGSSSHGGRVLEGVRVFTLKKPPRWCRLLDRNLARQRAPWESSLGHRRRLGFAARLSEDRFPSSTLTVRRGGPCGAERSL